MRTIEQVKTNARNIFKLMESLREQVALLDTEYQTNAVNLTGSRNEAWDNDIDNIKAAIASLNTLAHMEIDYADDLECPDEE